MDWYYYHGVCIDYTKSFKTKEAILEDWKSSTEHKGDLIYGDEELHDPLDLINGAESSAIEQADKDDAKDWFKGYKRN